MIVGALQCFRRKSRVSGKVLIFTFWVFVIKTPENVAITLNLSAHKWAIPRLETCSGICWSKRVTSLWLRTLTREHSKENIDLKITWSWAYCGYPDSWGFRWPYLSWSLLWLPCPVVLEFWWLYTNLDPWFWAVVFDRARSKSKPTHNSIFVCERSLYRVLCSRASSYSFRGGFLPMQSDAIYASTPSRIVSLLH